MKNILIGIEWCLLFSVFFILMCIWGLWWRDLYIEGKWRGKFVKFIILIGIMKELRKDGKVDGDGGLMIF